MTLFDDDHLTYLADPVEAKDHVRGPAAANVTLVEYGDFACPHCGEAYRVLIGLLHGDPDLRFVFRSNPRSHVFPQAALAAEAAEAAGVQGRFWEMHDLLFENQDALTREGVSRLARSLDLDVERFERELDAGTHRARVRAQEVSGLHSHVLSTPTFFINGVRFEGAAGALPAAIALAGEQERLNHELFREMRISSVGQGAPRISFGPHHILGDLPPAAGGRDAGPNPYDLLLAALGSSAAMAVAREAERHGLRSRCLELRLTQSRSPDGQHFRIMIGADGDLDAAQRTMLERAAATCPVARALHRPASVDAQVVSGEAIDEAIEASFPASDPPFWTLGSEPVR